jgi:SAM-dependent methyltransferase
MREDRTRWNRKYTNPEAAWSDYAIAEIVKKQAVMAPPGRALDIASGAGHNALYLAEMGYIVHALDISDAALRQVARRHPQIHAACVDLDHFDLPDERYELVINIRYLNRRLFPRIHNALVPGGILIFETFIDPPPHRPAATYNPDYLLQANELKDAFSHMEIVSYTEDWQQCTGGPGRVASLVARRR